MTMGLQRQKYLCQDCLWAAKAPCPRHPGRSLAMGMQWRPGKKGKKTRLWDNRVHGSQTVTAPAVRRGAWPSAYRPGGPFRVPFSPPRGLVHLGATDFSRGVPRSWYGDPVTMAIDSRNRKPARHGDLKLPSDELGWPFKLGEKVPR
jgi:hypothetical protein